jgi:hypothetical protein
MIAKFRTKPVIPAVVDAVQFTGTGASCAEVTEFLGGYHAANHTWDSNTNEGGTLIHADGRTNFGWGYWILRGEGGKFSVLSDDQFDLIYERIYPQIEEAADAMQRQSTRYGDLCKRLPSHVVTRVFESLGTASGCWDKLEGAGVFRSEECLAVGSNLCNFLADEIEKLTTRRLTPLHATEVARFPEEIQSFHLGLPKGLNETTARLVATFALVLGQKLFKAQEKHGNHKNPWESKEWRESCQAALLEHMGKGDPVDVAAYCAFMWFHGWPTVAPVPALADSAPIPVGHPGRAPLGCPVCKAVEVEASTPRTVYDCGSSDYDQRPGTFLQSEACKAKPAGESPVPPAAETFGGGA